jgi:diguanylate cyclase (GGDEF)-like protein
MLRTPFKKIAPYFSSIRIRILLGFGVGVLFTFLAAAIAFFSFNRVDDRVTSIIEKQAPALVQSIKLSAALSDVVTLIPNLTRVKTVDELNAELDALNIKKNILAEALSKINKLITNQQDSADQRLNLLKSITSTDELFLTNLNSLEKATVNDLLLRNDNAEKINNFVNIQAQLIALLQPIIASVQTNKNNSEYYNVMQMLLELKSDAVSLGNEITLVPTLADAESINISFQETNSLLDRMTYRAKLSAAGSVRDRFLKSITSMKELCCGSRVGIYTQQQQARVNQDLVDNFLIAHKKISGELEDSVNEFAVLQQRYSNNALLAAQQSVGSVKINLVILVALSLTISIVLAWLFVGPWFGNRLMIITRHLERITNGNLDIAIDVKFADELGQIEKGLLLFQQTAKARRNVETELIQMAQFDTLTGLPNRHLLHDRIERAISVAQRQDQIFAIMFIDLDRFKLVNDTQGHHVGDQLLTHVAKRLSSVIRKTDTVGRLGGDEFAILATLTKDDDIKVLAEKILMHMNQPVFMNSKEFFVGASIGISLYPTDGTDSATLLRKADTAMYIAKEQGGGHLQFFADEMNERTALRFEMHNQLREALHNREFQLWYQPQVRFETHEIVGVEALIRWHRPDGFIPPHRFISVAEEIGIIEELSEWVLDQACHDCRLWREAGFDFPVSVNVSAKQLVNAERFENALQKVLSHYHLEASFLVLEVTESAVMDDLAHSSDLLKRLRKQGHRIALDDFGTGYSSLNHLRSLPIDELKIDKTFIDNIAYSPMDIALTRVIVELGEQLGLSIVFEGVETLEQRRTLSLTGPHVYQGFHFSKPLPFADLIRLFGSQIANTPVLA